MRELASPRSLPLFPRSSFKLLLFLYILLLYILLLYCCPVPGNLVHLPVPGRLAGTDALEQSAGSTLSDLTLSSIVGDPVMLL